MGIKIQMAKTPYEIDQAARLRHTVFAEEEGYYPKQDDQIILDRYDILPTTVNFIAFVGDEIIGALRFTLNSDAGMPADNYFDYRPHLPYYDHRIVNGSMFCIKKAYRGNPRITRDLLWLGIYWGMSRGATHVLAPINPLTARFFLRAGFKAVGGEFICPKNGLPTLPMVLRISDGCESFLGFVKKQQLITLSDTFAREIYKPEERIINCGDVVKSCYFIVDGKVRVSIPVQDHEKHIRECGAGEIFGEDAIIADLPSSSNVTAATSVTLMILDQTSFQESILKHPERNSELMQTLSKRLVDTQRRLQDFLMFLPNTKPVNASCAQPNAPLSLATR